MESASIATAGTRVHGLAVFNAFCISTPGDYEVNDNKDIVLSDTALQYTCHEHKVGRPFPASAAFDMDRDCFYRNRSTEYYLRVSGGYLVALAVFTLLFVLLTLVSYLTHHEQVYTISLSLAWVLYLVAFGFTVGMGVLGLKFAGRLNDGIQNCSGYGQSVIVKGRGHDFAVYFALHMVFITLGNVCCTVKYMLSDASVYFA